MIMQIIRLMVFADCFMFRAMIIFSFKVNISAKQGFLRWLC